MKGMKKLPIKERLPKPDFIHAYARHNLHIIDADADAIPDSVDLRGFGTQRYVGSYLLAVDQNAGGYGKSDDTIRGVDYESRDFCVTPEQVTENFYTAKCVRVTSYINVHVHI